MSSNPENIPKARLNTQLNQQAVEEIKKLLYEGYKQDVIAERFGIAQAHVSRIVHGKVWADIPWPDGRTGAADFGAIVSAKQRRTNQELKSEVSNLIGKEGLGLISGDVEDSIDSPTIEQITRLAEKINKDREQELADALKDVGESAPVETPKSITPAKKQPHMAWEDVLKAREETQSLKSNGLIKLAEEYEQLRYPLGVVFHQLNPTQWNKPVAFTMLRSLCNLLGIEIGQGKEKGEDDDKVDS